MSLIRNKILYVCACLMLVAGLQGTWLPSAFAAGSLTLQVSPGFGGEYKDVNLVPLQITITNTGADIDGNLVLEADHSNDSTATYYVPVSIGKGTTKKVTLMVPGENLSPSDVVMFMAGEKEIARMAVGGRRVDEDNLLVGVLATDPDTANFLGALPRNVYSNPVRVVPLSGEGMPDSSATLQTIDVLVLNNFAADQLKPEQIQAIRDWVKQGGTLVMAGGTHYSKIAGAFGELSPVTVDGTASVSSLAGLAKGDQKKAVSLQQPFTLSKAAVKSGQVLYQEGSIPLFVKKPAGLGSVLYVAYDLAEEPLASWSGNGELWSGVLMKTLVSDRRESITRDGRYWNLTEAAQTFPSLQAPNFVWMAVAFAGYALLVGPIMFLVLRGKKRRGYIWGVVPVVSIATCFGLYFYGLYQHGSHVKVSTASHVELGGGGQAVVHSASAVFVPSGGDYEFRVKGSQTVLPVNINRGRGDSESVKEIWVQTSPQQSLVKFRDVEHWSIRTVYAKSVVDDTGKIESNLQYDAGKLVGTITNNTKYAWRDVKIINGRNVQDIGDLAVGASVPVNISNDFSMTGNGRDIFRAKQSLLPQEMQGSRDYRRSREFNMVQFLNERRGPYRQSQVYPVKLLGWVHEPMVDVEITGEKAKRDDLTLITTNLEIKPGKNGYVFYPAGTFEAIQKDSNASNLYEDEEGYGMDKGEITFDFPIDRQRLKVSKVYFFSFSRDKGSFDKQVYNWKTNAFDPYDKAFANDVLADDKVAQYLAADGTLRIKFINNSNDTRQLGMPSVGVEGWVVK